MRQALARAVHHARHRSVFQKRLIDQPLMAQVLADMALDAEAATALAFRLARAFDGGDDASEAAYRRLMTPVTKFWVCKTAPALVGEAMECMGGNGYVEEGGFPLLYREVPVNAIWEGSGNVMCLDVLRVIEKEPEAVDRVVADLDEAGRDDARLRPAIEGLRALLAECARDQRAARCLVEQLAVLAAGVLLLRHAPAAISDGFLATRLAGRWRSTYGAGSARADTRTILERAAPGRC
jgi:putative acyl-CoA dehydrogenase